MDYYGADETEAEPEYRHPADHPADRQQWLADTWVGDDWDADHESLLADAQQALSLADDYVRSRPWQTLAVVALVGIALGYGLARASKR
jgi:hypothetical protein